MNRQRAIQTIENLFPADSEYPDTAAVGQRLLEQAKRETRNGWRDLPDSVLSRYAELCAEEEHRQYREWERKQQNKF